MAEVQEKPKSVREQLGKIHDQLVADGKIQPDAEAAARAAGVPAFSEGTVALDENTGKPIAPKSATPTFTDGTTTTPEIDRSAATIGAPGPAATHERETPRAAASAPAEAPKPAAQEQGAQAAEAAAQALAPEIEFDEFEFEDPDLGTKFPVRVPKQYKEIAKRGYGRRAAHDRALTYLKEADPVLRSLIENGQIRQVLPLIQRAMSDPAFGEFVWGGYQRAQQGLPLIEQARQEAAAAGVQAPAPQAPEYDLSQEDPFFAERIRPLQQQFAQRYEGLEQKLARLEQERQEQHQRQINEQRTNEQRAQEMQQAHQDLGRAYPDLFRPDLGPNDPAWARAIQQAREAGYTDVYGLRAGIVFGGQLLHQMEQERLAATSSPAAQALQAQDVRLTEEARRQAAAASRTVAGGAPMQAPARKPLPKPGTRRADGSLKSPTEYRIEQEQWLASQAR